MERYRIAELAQATGLTPRTIRFYVAEGLLPPPEGAGPAAVYTAGHRDRLQLITSLKDQYLPLKEIRRRIATLTDAEVRDRLREEETAGPAPGATVADEAPPDDAVAYLSRALGGAAEGRTPLRAYSPPAPSTPPPAQPAPAPAAPGTPRPGQPGLPATGGHRRDGAARSAAREQWERIALADGVELHVREDRRTAVGPLEALIRQARKLLGEE
jgi:DNA-binding transcriptional MerR regulator